MPHVIDDHISQRRMARITGGSYVAFILASVLASTVGHIGLSDTQQVYQTIVMDPLSFRIGLVSSLVSALLFLLAAWGLHVLLRPVNHSLALLFLLLNSVGVAIQCASMFPLISALLLVDGPSGMQGYSAAQMEGAAYLSIDLYGTGFVTAQLFFGTWLFPLGYLVYKSHFLPRLLGILLILDGFAVLFWFLQALLLPAYPAISYPAFALSFVAEVALALWLLIKGVATKAVAMVEPGAGMPG